jgi:hypothetical protein
VPLEHGPQFLLGRRPSEVSYVQFLAQLDSFAAPDPIPRSEAPLAEIRVGPSDPQIYGAHRVTFGHVGTANSIGCTNRRDEPCSCAPIRRCLSRLTISHGWRRHDAKNRPKRSLQPSPAPGQSPPPHGDPCSGRRGARLHPPRKRFMMRLRCP